MSSRRRTTWNIFKTVIVLSVMAALVVAGLAIGYLLPRGPEIRTATATSTTPAPAAPRPLISLTHSVVMIMSTWDGTVTVPTKRGTVTIPVTSEGQCSAVFVQTGDRPQLLTSAHCVYDENVEQNLYDKVFSQLLMRGLNFTDIGPQDTWTLTGDNVDAVTQNVQIEPTLDSVTAFGRISPKLTVTSHGSPDTDDFATIELASPVKGAVALPVARAVPALGSPVVSVGYTGNYTGNVKEAYREADFPQGKVTTQQVLEDGQAITGVSTAISHGMSGGPTLDKYGNIIGLNMLAVGEEKYFVTDTAALRNYLDDNGITTARPSTRLLALDGE